MATLYVDSNNGSPATPFASWGAAANTLSVALADAACVAGSTVYVAHNHAETSAANNDIFATSADEQNPVKIICVNSSTGAYATSATITQTSTTYKIRFQHHMIIMGIQFYCANSIDWSADSTYYHEDCHFEITASSSAKTLRVNDDSRCIWRNCTVEFSHGTQSLTVGDGAVIEWIGGALHDGGDTLTQLVKVVGFGGRCSIRGVDLSAVNITNLVTAQWGIGNGLHYIPFDGCKLHANTSLMSGTINIPGNRVVARSCDTGDGYWNREEISYGGVLSHATNCKRTDGATYDGTNGYSAKIVSDANTEKYFDPNKNLLAALWSTANPTIRVEIIHDQMGSGTGSDFQDDEIWIEIEYPDSTDEALINHISTRRAYDDAAADYPNSAAAWTEDLTNEVKQYIEEAISDGAAGVYSVYLCVAPGAVKTVYACPKIEITAGS